MVYLVDGLPHALVELSREMAHAKAAQQRAEDKAARLVYDLLLRQE